MRIAGLMLVALFGLGQMTEVPVPDAVELHSDEIRELLEKDRKAIEAFPTAADGRNVEAQLAERYRFRVRRPGDVLADVFIVMMRSEADLDAFVSLAFNDAAARGDFVAKRAAENYPLHYMVLRRKDGSHVLMRIVSSVRAAPQPPAALAKPVKRPK